MEPVLIALALVGGACAGILVEHARRRARIVDVKREAERILEDARRQADAQVKEARVTAREELLAQRTEQERDLAERRAEIIKVEERLATNQSQLETTLEEVARREQSISDREAHAKQLQEELKAARDAQVAELERIAGMTALQGREALMAKLEEECRGDMAKLVRRIEEEARLEADKRARNSLSVAIQRTASGHSAGPSGTVVPLASGDLKGGSRGRLHYRTSYGQNVLTHSTECAPLASIMAAEPGASQKTARRAALLHDLGKAVTHEVEGPHAVISAQMAKRYRESPSVCHAIEAHHYDVEPQTVESVLVIAADAVSASRPGGRGESLEHYIKRLEELEKIATAKPGVERCYAMQAGREVRVMVKPEDVDDDGAALLSHEIAREIEEQLEYPGQIKVTVIRESRAVEVAK